VAPLFCSGHWHNYFLQLGQAVWASVQSIFLRCLWSPTRHFVNFFKRYIANLTQHLLPPLFITEKNVFLSYKTNHTNKEVNCNVTKRRFPSFKTSHTSKEVNCTEPFSSERFPSLSLGISWTHQRILSSRTIKSKYLCLSVPLLDMVVAVQEEVDPQTHRRNRKNRRTVITQCHYTVFRGHWRSGKISLSSLSTLWQIF
jgi:hypothetical protein